MLAQNTKRCTGCGLLESAVETAILQQDQARVERDAALTTLKALRFTCRICRKPSKGVSAAWGEHPICENCAAILAEDARQDATYREHWAAVDAMPARGKPEHWPEPSDEPPHLGEPPDDGEEVLP